MAHIIDDKLNKLEGKEKHNCDEWCKYWSFPHLDTACVLSGVFSVKKGCGCYNYVKKITAYNSEYKSIKNNRWFCERCQKEVDGASVKYEETHENCGGRCY